MTWSAKAQIEKPTVPPAPMVAAMGWVLPGSGYWLLGQKSRALVVGITILCIWMIGLAVGGVRVIEVPGFDEFGRRIPDARLLDQLRDKPWSIARVLVGPVAVVSGSLSVYAARPADGGVLDESRAPLAHARLWEIPVLYTAVAGMLNLIALIDAAHRARHARGDR